jgi:hypothetical protein
LIRTIYVHRADEDNPGDRWSCPKHYIGDRFTPVQTIDVSDPREPVEADAIIVGGGDIIGKTYWLEAIAMILKSQRAKKILWGAGAYIGKHLIRLDLMKQFSHIGLRNGAHRYDWVPCASVMHQTFKDRPQAPKDSILIVDHFKRNLYVALPVKRIVNKPQTFETMVGEIKAHDLIITNSYHAVYWATILNKRVIVVGVKLPGKLQTIKHRPLIIPQWDNRAIEVAWRYPQAYDECLEANKNFYKSIQ